MGSLSVIMLPFLLLLTVVSAAKLQDKAVVPHWEAACNTSLLFSEKLETWEEASGECELYGGNLVQIRSMEMNYCILRHAHDKALPAYWYWHSGNDIDEEGVYRYNGGRSCNCMVLGLSSGENAGLWADIPCNSLRRYICQR